MSEDSSQTPPDRLSVNPKSPHFDASKLERGIGIRFKDRVRTDVEEYCISEGWIRVQAGKSVDRKAASPRLITKCLAHCVCAAQRPHR